MISLANVVGSPIHLHALQDLRNKNIGIGVAVAVRVRRQIVRHQVGADRDELSDGFTMIAGYPGGKVLRGFNSAGSGFDGISGNGNRSARPAGVGIEKVLTNVHFFRGVRRKYIQRIDVGGDSHRVTSRDQRYELKIKAACPGTQFDWFRERLKHRRRDREVIGSRGIQFELELPFGVRDRLVRFFALDKKYARSGDRPSLPVDYPAGYGEIGRQGRRGEEQDGQGPQKPTKTLHRAPFRPHKERQVAREGVPFAGNSTRFSLGWPRW